MKRWWRVGGKARHEQLPGLHTQPNGRGFERIDVEVFLPPQYALRRRAGDACLLKAADSRRLVRLQLSPCAVLDQRQCVLCARLSDTHPITVIGMRYRVRFALRYRNR